MWMDDNEVLEFMNPVKNRDSCPCHGTREPANYTNMLGLSIINLGVPYCTFNISGTLPVSISQV